MTEVWKSNPKKFCEICKCWFADNRISIQFHENGERHKANVQNKVREISKKGAERIKEEKSKNKMLAKMERDALEAYHKDLVAMGATTSEENTGDTASDTIRLHPHQTSWAEAFTEEGYQYFWNIETEESVWEVPEEGFMSAADYQRLVDAYNNASKTVEISSERLEPVPVEPSSKMLRGKASTKRKQPDSKSSQNKKRVDGRKFSKSATKTSPNDEAVSVNEGSETEDAEPVKERDQSSSAPRGPVYEAPAIGRWTAVIEEIPEKEIDWGIPSLRNPAPVAQPAPELPMQEDKIKFKEKVAKLGKYSDKNATVSFKKPSSLKRNLKKRDGDNEDSD